MSAIEEHGFQIIPDVVDHSTLAEIGDALSDEALRHSRAGMRNAFRVEAVRRLAHNDCLMQFTKPVLGVNAVPFRATLFDKSTRSNWLVVSHQDTALPLREREEKPGWGPGTHRLGVLTDDVICDLANSVLAVECCVPAGGVLLMRPLLVHASSKAKQDAKPRRVLHIEYASSAELFDGLELAVLGGDSLLRR